MELIRTVTWVALADAACAKIYSWHHDKKVLQLVAQLDHPEGKELPQEYVNYEAGHYQAGDARGSYSPHTDLKTSENDHFAQHIIKALDEGRVHNKFDDLIIVAEPHFHGLLDKHLHHPLKEKVSQHIMKDYMYIEEKELAAKLFK